MQGEATSLLQERDLDSSQDAFSDRAPRASRRLLSSQSGGCEDRTNTPSPTWFQRDCVFSSEPAKTIISQLSSLSLSNSDGDPSLATTPFPPACNKSQSRPESSDASKEVTLPLQPEQDAVNNCEAVSIKSLKRSPTSGCILPSYSFSTQDTKEPAAENQDSSLTSHLQEEKTVQKQTEPTDTLTTCPSDDREAFFLSSSWMADSCDESLQHSLVFPQSDTATLEREELEKEQSRKQGTMKKVKKLFSRIKHSVTSRSASSTLERETQPPPMAATAVSPATLRRRLITRRQMSADDSLAKVGSVYSQGSSGYGSGYGSRSGSESNSIRWRSSVAAISTLNSNCPSHDDLSRQGSVNSRESSTSYRPNAVRAGFPLSQKKRASYTKELLSFPSHSDDEEDEEDEGFLEQRLLMMTADSAKASRRRPGSLQITQKGMKYSSSRKKYSPVSTVHPLPNPEGKTPIAKRMASLQTYNDTSCKQLTNGGDVPRNSCVSREFNEILHGLSSLFGETHVEQFHLSLSAEDNSIELDTALIPAPSPPPPPHSKIYLSAADILQNALTNLLPDLEDAPGVNPQDTGLEMSTTN